MNNSFMCISLETGGTESCSSEQLIQVNGKVESKVSSILEIKQKYILPENRVPDHFQSGDEVWYYESHSYPDMRPCPEADKLMEYIDGVVESVSGGKVKVKTELNGNIKDLEYNTNDIFKKSDICDLHENNGLQKLKADSPLEKLQVINLNRKIKKLLEGSGVSIRDYFEAQTELKKISSRKPRTRI